MNNEKHKKKERVKIHNKKKMSKVLSAFLVTGMLSGILPTNITYAENNGVSTYSSEIVNGTACTEREIDSSIAINADYSEYVTIAEGDYNLYSVNSVKHATTPAVQTLVPINNVGGVISSGEGNHLISADAEQVKFAKAQTGVGTLIADNEGNTYGFTYSSTSSTLKIYYFNSTDGTRENYNSVSFKAAYVFYDSNNDKFKAINTTFDMYDIKVNDKDDLGINNEEKVSLEKEKDGLTLHSIKYAESLNSGGFIVAATVKKVTQDENGKDKTVTVPAVIKYNADGTIDWAKDYDCSSLTKVYQVGTKYIAQTDSKTGVLLIDGNNGSSKIVELDDSSFKEISTDGSKIVATYSDKVKVLKLNGDTIETDSKIEFKDSGLSVSSAVISEGKLYVSITNSNNAFRNDYIGSYSYSSICTFVTDKKVSATLEASLTRYSEDVETLGTAKNGKIDHRIIVSPSDSNKLILTREYGINNADIAMFNASEFIAIGTESTTVSGKTGSFLYIEMKEDTKYVKYYYDQYDNYVGKISSTSSSNDSNSGSNGDSNNGGTTTPSTPTEDREILATETNKEATMNVIKGESGEIIVSIIKDGNINDLDEKYEDYIVKNLSSTDDSFILTLEDDDEATKIIIFDNEGTKVSEKNMVECGEITLNDDRKIIVYEEDGAIRIYQIKDGVVKDKGIVEDATKYIGMEPTVDGGFKLTVIKSGGRYIQKYTKNSVLLDEEISGVTIRTISGETVTMSLSIEDDTTTFSTANGNISVANFVATEAETTSLGNAVVSGENNEIVVVTSNGDIISGESIETNDYTTINTMAYLELSNGNFVVAGNATDEVKVSSAESGSLLGKAIGAIDDIFTTEVYASSGLLDGIIIEYSAEGTLLNVKSIPASYGVGGDATITELKEVSEGVVSVSGEKLNATLMNTPTYTDNRELVETVTYTTGEVISVVNDGLSADSYVLKLSNGIYEVDLSSYRNVDNIDFIVSEASQNIIIQVKNLDGTTSLDRLDMSTGELIKGSGITNGLGSFVNNITNIIVLPNENIIVSGNVENSSTGLNDAIIVEISSSLSYVGEVVFEATDENENPIINTVEVNEDGTITVSGTNLNKGTVEVVEVDNSSQNDDGSIVIDLATLDNNNEDNTLNDNVEVISVDEVMEESNKEKESNLPITGGVGVMPILGIGTLVLAVGIISVRKRRIK